jgi:hypothetical protein
MVEIFPGAVRDADEIEQAISAVALQTGTRRAREHHDV